MDTSDARIMGKIGGNFSNMGCYTGGVYHIPPEQAAGATQVDESCAEYTGNPRDSAGKVGGSGNGNNGSGNTVPSGQLRPCRDC